MLRALKHATLHVGSTQHMFIHSFTESARVAFSVHTVFLDRMDASESRATQLHQTLLQPSTMMSIQTGDKKRGTCLRHVSRKTAACPTNIII